MKEPDIEIEVPILARVEGEGALHLTVNGGVVERADLRIYEPPRFFEAFLRGRGFAEPIDLTARICGICPVAYQMSAAHALERACGVEIPESIRQLRRLLYCGEWIGSHTLHIGFLHAPDFLGYPSGIAIAEDHPDLVRSILSLKQTGNDIMTVLGGRSVHPVNVCVGGFHRLPDPRQLERLATVLGPARTQAIELVEWAATLDFPDYERDYVFMSLRHSHDYPFSEGRIVSSNGLDVDVSEYENVITEYQVPHSTAKHARLAGAGDGELFVGPLARYALNYDRLPDQVQKLAVSVGLPPVVRNPFKSILVRGIETVYAIDEAIRIIDAYVRPPRAAVEVSTRPSTGWAATEAPRGTLYHRYRIDDDGLIAEANIIPPTAQNQPAIEADLRDVATDSLGLKRAELIALCEQTIRNYDPCISCATHFLSVDIHDAGGGRPLSDFVIE
jgi:coenzyme F420-reducing hydrogenase alpha subunit